MCSVYSSTRVVRLDAISESPGSSTGCPSQVFTNILKSDTVRNAIIPFYLSIFVWLLQISSKKIFMVTSFKCCRFLGKAISIAAELINSGTSPISVHYGIQTPLETFPSGTLPMIAK